MARFESVPLDLLGLDEKTDKRHKATGTLKTADNVVLDKKGKFSKRRGYDRIDLVSSSIEATNAGAELCYVGVATYQDELVVFGYDTLYSILSHEALVATTRYTRKRGPWPRGNINTIDVTSGQAGNTEPVG